MPKYIDKRKIGSGGFGEVWQCEREEDGTQHAKKKLTVADTDAVARFLKEVRILASLNHPNVVRVIGKRLETPPYWYVMPLYDHSLRSELPALIGDDRRIHQVFTTILGAVEYAHSEGIIHRDLKPENVLMNDDTDLVVSDFGLGRALDSESTRTTVTGFGMGTLPYMAPEQLNDAKHADVRSDVYSLGRMLYELYTEALTVAPQDLTRLSPAVALVVARATQPRPENRYQTVTEMKQVWLNVVGSTGSEAELEDYSLLLVKLSASGPVDVADVDQLCTLLAKRLPDDDLVHKTIMEIHPDAVVALHVRDDDFARQLLDRFALFTAGQNWPWSYTDRIANACREVFRALDDAVIRAALIACVVEVGISHNRFYVWEVTTALLTEVRRGEDVVVAARLEENVPQDHIADAARHVQGLTKVAPQLRRIMQAALDAQR